MPLTLDGNTGVQGNSGAFVAGTAVNSTSGTSIDFTSIPSWVKRVTVLFNQVSSSGSSAPLIQIGTSSGVTTTGYVSSGSYTDTGTNLVTSTAGFVMFGNGANQRLSGHMTISFVGSNIWVASFTCGSSSTVFNTYGGGSVTLAATLDRVRITRVNGTDVFNNGSINILYE
jgi:hypothetical protein